MEHMGYLRFMEKLTKCCFWFGTYIKPCIIWDPKSLNSIPEKVFLTKTKLNNIDVLISKDLIDTDISHDEFVSVNMLEEWHGRSSEKS